MVPFGELETINHWGWGLVGFLGGRIAGEGRREAPVSDGVVDTSAAWSLALGVVLLRGVSMKWEGRKQFSGQLKCSSVSCSDVL